MRFCCVDAKGEITQVGTVPDTADAEVFSHFSDTVLTDIPESVDSNTHYVQQGEFIQFGEPPAFGVWDWESYSWQQDRALAEKSVRAKRQSLLTASDWTQLPDVPLETKAAWAVNRQALRDITTQVGFPFDVAWPESPKGPAA